MRFRLPTLSLILAVSLAACSNDTPENNAQAPRYTPIDTPDVASVYKTVQLTANIDHLSSQQRKMLLELFAAARIMDQLFWRQSYGNADYLIPFIDDANAKQYAVINYGPWDRLDNNRPFLSDTPPKPTGARFYPADMSEAEFNAWSEPNKTGLYSIVTRRDNGELLLTPYHKAYAPSLQRAAEHLRNAADLAEDPLFAEYLTLRADALLSDEYIASDSLWLDMQDNAIDMVVGPIETYEDSLFGYRAAYEAYILIKDQEWSEKLKRFVSYLPQLQRDLPVPEQYKQDPVGQQAQLNAYDVIFYAGHANAGSKTIAINLPNDEGIQQRKGTRRLQLKNAMRAKFDHILKPISEHLVDPGQRQHITFEAFFTNTMFHEVAHGLGIKNVISGDQSVSAALQETASSVEEGKADVLGLYMVTQLHNAGELGDTALEDYYVTFMASVFRSVRFGAASAHGIANMVRFNYFVDEGAFIRDATTGTYRVDMAAMKDAVNHLSRLLLVIQGDGDRLAAQRLIADRGQLMSPLFEDLARLKEANIPVDVMFEQGEKLLGLH